MLNSRSTGCGELLGLSDSEDIAGVTFCISTYTFCKFGAVIGLTVISFDFSFFYNCGPSGEEVLKVSRKLSTSEISDSSESVFNCSESLDAITAFIISSAE